MQQLFDIRQWVDSLVVEKKIFIKEPWHIQILQGDASCRIYFRLIGGEDSYILVASPIDRIDNRLFVNIAKKWRAEGVNVPRVYHIDALLGFMLIEDFGEMHLFDLLNKQPDIALYKKAIMQMVVIQQTPHTDLGVFDRGFLLREMQLFDAWFLKYQLGIQTPDLLSQVYEVLIDNALSQPQTTMHRDFHSRNLLWFDDQVAVIDFQDAMRGPLAYDLVSLLKDCYLSLSQESIDSLIDYYLLQENTNASFDFKIDREKFVKWFDLLGMQRHLKVLGLFIRLAAQEAKPRYLEELPRVFNYLVDSAAKYSEFDDFHAWLVKSLQPSLKQQSWFRS